MNSRNFVWWLAEWNMHARPLQRKIAGAALAAAYCQLGLEGKHPRTEIRRLAAGLPDQIAELLHYALRELDRIELDFESREGRLPNAAELCHLASLEAEEELKRELADWGASPF